MNIYIANISTDDGRLTKGRVYYGVTDYCGHPAQSGSRFRVSVRDNKGQRMSFDPAVLDRQHTAHSSPPRKSFWEIVYETFSKLRAL